MTNSNSVEPQRADIRFRVSERVRLLARELRSRPGVPSRVVGSIVGRLYRFAALAFLGVDIPVDTPSDGPLCIHHGYGLVVSSHARFGRGVILRQATTVGATDGVGTAPTFGDYVDVGANACVIGPIRVGSHVRIGAGAVVVADVSDNSTVVGNPARVISGGES